MILKDMKLIDTHCHIDLEAFATDRQQVIDRAFKAGVQDLVVPGVTAKRWKVLTGLAEQNPHLHFALGLHPYFIDQHSEPDLKELERLLEQEHVVAVGEIGLDYYDGSLDRDRQLFFFEEQVELASRFELPIIVHARKSHDDIIQVLKKNMFTQGGIMHAFNGSLQQAHVFIDMGFKLGFGGMLTYQHSSKLRKLARDLPATGIVLETDAPDMTVASHRGERNSPEYLPEILASLAEVRQQNSDELAEQTTNNANEVLRLG